MVMDETPLGEQTERDAMRPPTYSAYHEQGEKSTGKWKERRESAFFTQVSGQIYGISRLEKTGAGCYYTGTKR
jgi:hypothetical protein